MSAERCNCGTHTKAACDFAGACRPVAAPLPAAPAPTRQTFAQRVAAAQAELWSWPPELRASVRLEGGDAALPAEQAGELPPLPEPRDRGIYKHNQTPRTPCDLFGPDEMQDYARAAYAMGRASAVRDYVCLNDAALAVRQATDHCAMCNNTGIVGRAPDDYFDCPDCVAARQAPTEAPKEPRRKILMPSGMIDVTPDRQEKAQ